LFFLPPAGDSKSAKSHWIQCDDCSKWRKFSKGTDFPETFTCSSAGQEEPFNCCEAALQDGFPTADDTEQEESNDEVTPVTHFTAVYYTLYKITLS
jgi:hypothetical protein